jgi:hypothetical protein
MTLKARYENKTPILSQGLLLSVAEEIKMPLMQIASLAEHAQYADDAQATSKLINSTASSALKLLDNYMLGVRLSLEPQNFDLESVSISSILYDTCQQLDVFAKSYGVNLELNIAGKFGPVSANKLGLEAALVSLGASLIEALPAIGN